MRSLIAALSLLFAATAFADSGTVVVTGRRPAVVVTSAQDHAVYLARRGLFVHSSCGQCEGIGEGSTPEAARRNCCFFGRRQIVDEGVAWSPLRRRWVAVIRYQ